MIPAISGDFEGFVTSAEEVLQILVETARTWLEVEPEDVTDLLQSHDQTLMDEELPLTGEQSKFFLEIEPTSGEGTMKIVEMPTKDLECYINLIGKKKK